MKRHVCLIIGAMLLTSTFAALAQASAKEGGGGDMCEDRIKNVRDDIASWIKEGGPTGLTLPKGTSLDQYNSKMLAKITEARVGCTDNGVMIGKANKTCEYFTDTDGTPRIVCNRKSFMAETGASDQYVLIHHEYAGLAGIEPADGDVSHYTVSNQISGFLTTEEVTKLAVHPIVRCNPGLMAKAPASFACRSQDGTVWKSEGAVYKFHWYGGWQAARVYLDTKSGISVTAPIAEDMEYPFEWLRDLCTHDYRLPSGYPEQLEGTGGIPATPSDFTTLQRDGILQVVPDLYDNVFWSSTFEPDSTVLSRIFPKSTVFVFDGSTGRFTTNLNGDYGSVLCVSGGTNPPKQN